MSKRPYAILFPGQGSQVVGMGKDFVANFKESALIFEEASDTLRLNLKNLCFEGPLEELTLTENLQPALFTVEAAILAALRVHTDLNAVVCAGHSLGEYSALYAVGSLKLSDGVTLTRARGKAMQNAVPLGRGTMAAVLGLDAQAVDILCAKTRESLDGDVVEAANYNAPGQVVVAGTIGGIAALEQVVKEDPEYKRVKVMRLQVSAPFHCSLMKPAQDAMDVLLKATKFTDPSFPVITNCNAKLTKSGAEFSSLLHAQIVQAVRWEMSMTQLRSLGVEMAFEVGPGKVLAGLHKRIDREMPVVNISSVEELKGAFK